MGGDAKFEQDEDGMVGGGGDTPDNL